MEIMIGDSILHRSENVYMHAAVTHTPRNDYIVGSTVLQFVSCNINKCIWIILGSIRGPKLAQLYSIQTVFIVGVLQDKITY